MYKSVPTNERGKLFQLKGKYKQTNKIERNLKRFKNNIGLYINIFIPMGKIYFLFVDRFNIEDIFYLQIGLISFIRH